MQENEFNELKVISKFAPQLVVPIGEGFEKTFNMELTFSDPPKLLSKVKLGIHLCQPLGIIHGGVYASIAESMASIGTAREVLPQGKVAIGQSNATYFLRPVSYDAGYIYASAMPKHMGKTSWIWDIDITDEEKRVCATSRVTIAVLDPDRIKQSKKVENDSEA